MVHNMEQESVNLEAHKLINQGKHGARRKAYGHPLDDYSRSVGAFNKLTGRDLTPEEGIIFMICVKLSRECNSPKRDNRLDGCGYFGCLDEVHLEKERRKIKTPLAK